ncbi:unnamed protein product [Rotaria sordida]|uniref:Uncharacterized protein n=1 Tax=Rotaria sordida TaxID=392033 RepID=A0A815D9Q4_9BILA|nr:unnamed protein product [Rotaria sordida]
MSKTFFSQLFKSNSSTFHAAILADNTNKICRILDVKRDFLHKPLDNKGNTALLLAIKHASPLTVRLLLEEGASPDQPNFIGGQTPLGFLATTIYEDDKSPEAKMAVEMATILLNNKADIDKTSPYTCFDESRKEYVIMETPLMTAARTKNLAMAKLLVERKANVNYVEKLFQNRPIHFSITNGDLVMFSLLESAGASCRSVVATGQNTLLHCFCQHKANDQQMHLLEKLINRGCDVNAENNNRRTPLMFAARLEMINTCCVLINAYADINKTDYKGNRAIDYTKQDSECFKLLQRVIYIQQAKSQSHQNKDRTHSKKYHQSTSSVPVEKSVSTKHLKGDKKTSEHRSNLLRSRSDQVHNAEEINKKHKSMWDKLLEAKPMRSKSREVLPEKSTDSFGKKKRDLSENRITDFNQKKNPTVIKF